MTRQNVQVAFTRHSPQARIDAYFAGMGQGLNPATLRRERLPLVAELDALSDTDLQRMGLTRDGIVAHVFRDLLAS